MSKVKDASTQSTEGTGEVSAKVGFKRGPVNASAADIRIGFPISSQRPFHECYISSVESRDITPDADDAEGKEKVPALFFHLTHAEDDRMSEDIAIWEVSRAYDNFTIEQQEAKQDFIISSIYRGFAQQPDDLGAAAENYKEFFDAIALSFNTGNNGKPIYQDKNGNPFLCRVKLVRYGKKIDVPRFGPFIEVVQPGKMSILAVTPYDKFDAEAVTPARAAKAAATRNETPSGIKIPQGFQ